MDDVFQLRDYLYEKTGLYLPDGRRYLFEGQFLKCMEALGISSISKYFSYLKSSEGQKSALGQLINEIAGNETSFFGDQTRFRALEDIFLPDLVFTKEKLGIKKIRIWSAGCSSGEEAYAIAMVLDSLKDSLLKDWDIKIWATDINSPILERAKLGHYEDYSLQGIPSNFKASYLKSNGSGVEITQALKQYVDFEYFNLNGNGQDSKIVSEIDIIYCSNVLIRFDLAIRQKIIQNFYDALNERGYFLLGYYESLHGLKNGFRHVHFTGGMCYRKITNGE